MRRMMLPLILLVFAACQPTTTRLTDENRAAIRALAVTYAEANLAGDADAVAAVYAENAIEMPPNAVVRDGRASIKATYAESFEAHPPLASEFALTSVQIDGRDDLAFDRGTWTWVGTPHGMTDTVTTTGTYVAIVRRQADGDWLWTAIIWNSDGPPATVEGEHTEGEDHT